MRDCLRNARRAGHHAVIKGTRLFINGKEHRSEAPTPTQIALLSTSQTSPTPTRIATANDNDTGPPGLLPTI
jgi:hypothetical protein